MKSKLLFVVFVCLSLIATGNVHAAKQYSIEQFLSVKKYAGGSFNFNEEKILFSSDESGIFNIYSIPRIGGSQTQLTNSVNHSILLITTFPHDDRFLYSSDGLGNELSHIYLQNLDGSVRDLTPWPKAKSQFHGWSKDQDSFYFLSNERDPKYMDLYEMDIATFQFKVLYKNEIGLDIASISKDKRFLVLRKVLSSNNSELFLYDFSTKVLKNLTPHEGDVKYYAVGFSEDSNELYFLTNQDSEFNYLKSVQLTSGDTAIVEKYEWNIDFCAFSRTGQYRVTEVNEDAKTKMHLFDMHTNKKIPLPQFSEGEITQIKFSKNEKWMLFYVGGDRTPGDLYVYNLENAEFYRLTDSLNAGINREDLVEAEVIRFPSYDGMMIPALYYQPKDMPTDKKLPALLWMHGGPGGQSTKGYNYLIQFLVNHGYPVLSVNNRGSSGYGKSFFKAADHKHGEADLDDCISAKNFLVTRGIDKNKVGIMGNSYGGYLTLAALAFRPNEMACGVDIFGVSNWVRTLKSIPSWWETERETLYKKIGNPYTETAYLESISPLFHADKIRRPLLVIQGANDPRVLKIESDQIIEALNKLGVPNQYVVFDDEGHGFRKKQNQMKAATVILDFLDEYLK